MNARLAVEENKMLVSELLENSKEMAARLGITVEEAIDKKVAVYVKRAKNETEAAAWELRGDEAKNLNSPKELVLTSEDVRISKISTSAWVNVEFKNQDVQFELLNSEEVTDVKVIDNVVMAFNICHNIDQIIEHCDRNGVSLALDIITELS